MISSFILRDNRVSRKNFAAGLSTIVIFHRIWQVISELDGFRADIGSRFDNKRARSIPILNQTAYPRGIPFPLKRSAIGARAKYRSIRNAWYRRNRYLISSSSLPTVQGVKARIPLWDRSTIKLGGEDGGKIYQTRKVLPLRDLALRVTTWARFHKDILYFLAKCPLRIRHFPVLIFSNSSTERERGRVKSRARIDAVRGKFHFHNTSHLSSTFHPLLRVSLFRGVCSYPVRGVFLRGACKHLSINGTGENFLRK